MIERLLAAERAFAAGELDLADRLFRQVADADPRNAIAVVGLARVAERRGAQAEAVELVERALELDPEEAAALKMRDVLREENDGLGAAPHATAGDERVAVPAQEHVAVPAQEHVAVVAQEHVAVSAHEEPPTAPTTTARTATAPTTTADEEAAMASDAAPPRQDEAGIPAEPPPDSRRGLFDRLRAWLRRLFGG